LEQSDEHVSFCRNNAREILADWKIAKKAARTFDKIRYGDNQGGRSREQKIVRVRVRTLFDGSSTNN